MASPHVAGVAALIVSQFGNLGSPNGKMSPGRVAAYLGQTADPQPCPSGPTGRLPELPRRGRRSSPDLPGRHRLQQLVRQRPGERAQRGHARAVTTRSIGNDEGPVHAGPSVRPGPDLPSAHGRQTRSRGAVDDRGSRRLVRVPRGDAGSNRSPLPRGRAVGVGPSETATARRQHETHEAPPRSCSLGSGGNAGSRCYPVVTAMPMSLTNTQRALRPSSDDRSARALQGDSFCFDCSGGPSRLPTSALAQTSPQHLHLQRT